MKKDNKKYEKLRSEERAANMKKLVINNMSHIKYKYLVLSGKGGVGKTTVATNLAITLTQLGFAVGLFGADIHGPNIPKMLGIEDKKFHTYEKGIIPVYAGHLLKVMSVAFLLKSKDDAVIFRGPLKHKLIGQLLSES